MKYIRWNHDKNRQLESERGVSFEDVFIALEKGDIFDDYQHPNKNRYENQRIFIVNVRGYFYLVPYVETKDEIFLKTMIPSRKITKKYSVK